MKQHEHLVFETTINGIIDTVFVFKHIESADAVATTREFFTYAKPDQRLSLRVCDCNNPDSHKDTRTTPG